MGIPDPRCIADSCVNLAAGEFGTTSWASAPCPTGCPEGPQGKEGAVKTVTWTQMVFFVPRCLVKTLG